MDMKILTYSGQLKNQPNIKSLLELLEEYDLFTYQHSINVAEMTEKICMMLKWPREDIICVTSGALLHDIGKLFVPLSVLNKIEPLEEKEIDEIKKHPFYGHELARLCGHPPNVCKIILNHHEREDGSGYLFHLEGEAISMESKIVALADVFCAMTENRCYKMAYTKEEAMQKIKRDSEMFEPRLVSILEWLVSKECIK